MALLFYKTAVRNTHRSRLQEPEAASPVHFPAHRVHLQEEHHRTVRAHAAKGGEGGDQGPKVWIHGRNDKGGALPEGPQAFRSC